MIWQLFDFLVPKVAWTWDMRYAVKFNNNLQFAKKIITEEKSQSLD